MKNAHRIHFESQGTAFRTASSQGVSVHRLGTMFAVAMSILLLGLICSAQTNTYIPQFNGLSLTNSIMNQPSTSQINVNNGNFNLTNFANTYKISGKDVLKVTDFPGSGHMRSLSLGIGAGSISSTASGTGSNTFVGAGAGSLNTNSAANTFVGDEAGYKNTTGGWNVCMGSGACFSNSVSTGNTMLGTYSGFNTTGGSNTFLGIGAGGNTTTGSSNIYIGPNAQGAPTENNTIRIGVNGGGSGQQNRVFIEPLESAPIITANIVSFDPVTGQLGRYVSSRRFKEQIADMGDSSSKLLQLRPVTYFYKAQYDGTHHQLQYGLIAEEVAEIYPELVALDKDGQPYSVNYQALAPLLLNELQKQHAVVETQRSQLKTQLQQISEQRQEIEGLKLQLQQQNVSLQERLTRLESYVATQMKMASDTRSVPTLTANGGLQ